VHSKPVIGQESNNENYTKKIVALDLGTTKFCIAHALYSNNNEIYKIEFSHTPAEGMHRGMLSNKEKAVKSLQKLIENHEEKYQLDIRDVVVGIAGSHLKGQTFIASKKLPKMIAHQKDLHELNKDAISRINNTFREALHVIPISYLIDNRKIEKPIGSHGTNLSCEYFVIDADRGYLKDVIDLCNESGLIIRRFYSEPFASSSVILCDQLKTSGCTIIDIGGGTSDGIVFINNKPVSVYTINIAGKMMTNDLSIGLGISIHDAEIIKHSLRYLESEYRVTDIFGRSKLIRRSDCMKILLPRLQELALLIKKELRLYKHLLAGGIILTGGGSEATDILTVFRDICDLPTQCVQPILNIKPRFYKDNESDFGGPMSTVLGLLNLEIDSLSGNLSSHYSHWSQRFFGTFLNWIRELY
jgi:cell division protein FtsA